MVLQRRLDHRDVPMPRRQRLRLQVGSSGVTLYEQQQADDGCGSSRTEDPTVGHHEVGEAGRDHRQSIGDQRRHVEQFHTDDCADDVAHDRRHSCTKIESKQTPPAASAALLTVSPRPAFVPHEVVQDCGLDGHGCRQSVRNLPPACECEERQHLHAKSDCANDEERGETRGHTTLRSSARTGIGSAR